MGIDERARHDLYVGLEELMGADRADALMGLLPPVGWADVATKHDLVALEERIDLRFRGIDERLDGLEERMDLRFTSLEHSLRAEFQSGLRSQMRALFFGLVTTMTTMTLIFLAALALIR